MSRKKKRKLSSTVVYDPGLLEARRVEMPGVELIGQSHCALQFGSGGTPEAVNQEGLEGRRKLAIMLSAIERKSRPWCPECNVHRVSKSKEDILDVMCGICSRVAAEYGPRNILKWHDHFCGSCSAKRTGLKVEAP